MKKRRHSFPFGSSKRLAWVLAPALLLAGSVRGLAQDNDPGNGQPQFKNSFDRLVFQIDGAGRVPDTRRLEALLRDIDAELVKPKKEAENACWQILKSTVEIELSRYRDARASLGVLAETCPVWEVLNNLAVLETREGALGRSASLLQAAIQLADPGEKKLAQANRRALLDPIVEPGDTRLPPTLLLVGVPAECTRAVAADCDGPPARTPRVKAPPRQTPPAPPPAAPMPPVEVIFDPPGESGSKVGVDLSLPDDEPTGGSEPAGEEPIGDREEEAAEPEAGKAAVRAVVESWVAAWNARSIDEYVAFYVDQDRVPSGRVLNIGNKARISVETTEMEVDAADPTRYLAVFTQTYCSEFEQGGRFDDQVVKELELVQVEGSWKIDLESVIEQREEPTCE